MSVHRGPTQIVLTGGPCGGKSSALQYLVGHLSARGWRVLVVPEAASMLIAGGLHDMGELAANDRAGFLTVQKHLLQVQAGLRETFVRLAGDLARCGSLCDPACESGCHESHRVVAKRLHNPEGCAGQVRTVVLFDRAELDNRAYMEEHEFVGVLAQTLGLSPAEAGARYDAVLHLVTAADGAEEHYTLENNAARTETVEQAVALDRATQAAWLGHPHLVVVGNEGEFERKLSRVLAAVLGVMGEPEPIEIERKWVLAQAPSDGLLAGAVPVEIEQIYLPGDGAGGERRVRARTHDGHTTYFHTVKTPTTDGVGRVEREEIISAESYRLLSGMRTEGSAVVRKRRFCMVHEGQHFEVDHVVEPVDLWLVEAELVSADDVVRLPSEFVGAVEVTDDPVWGNAAIARRSTGTPTV